MSPANPIRNFMTRIPYTVDTSTPVRAALALMRRHGIRHLPVEENSRTVGIISDWDLLSADSLEKTLDRSVGAIMIRNPRQVPEETPLTEAVRIMAEEGLGCLPVFDQHAALVGIFTEKDAVRAFSKTANWMEPPTRAARAL